MRAVSFAQACVCEFAGNVVAAAVALGDVDNDGGNELVVGNITGTVAIFKGIQSAKPWRVCHNLGSIACVAVGDVRNTGRNSVVVVTSEGKCHVFDLSAEEGTGDPADWPLVIPAASATHGVPVNISRLLIADFDGDGLNEFIMARTDRLLQVFRCLADVEDRPDGKAGVFNTFAMTELGKWMLPSAVGSLAVTRTMDGSPELLIAQSGGYFVSLQAGGSVQPDRRFSSSAPVGADIAGATELVLLSPTGNGSSSRLSSREHTPIAPEQSDHVALVSLDGTIKLFNHSAKMWELQVSHRLFAVSRGDFDGDGQQELVTCSWDGLTCIASRHQNTVRFQFPSPVSAFAAGLFAREPGVHVHVLVYVTYNDRIHIYHDVEMRSIALKTLNDEMKGDAALFPEQLQGALQQDSAQAPPELAEFFHASLYDSATAERLVKLRDALQRQADALHAS